MKIRLINTYSTHNIGDFAIYSALQQLLNKHDVQANFTDDKPYPIKGIECINQPSTPDYYISVGGDIFNNPRKNFITRRFIYNLQQLIKNPKLTILFGQSIPRSCSGLSFWILCLVLKKIKAVVVRDQESFNRLTNAGVKSILTYDCAFILQTNIEAKKEALNHFKELNIDKNKCAILSLREFDDLYSYNNDSFIKNIVELCHKLFESGKKPVLLIQADADSMDSDYAIADKIQQQCNFVKIINAFTHSNKVSHCQFLQAIISEAGLVIAVRYHTAVLALASGKLPYNLFYSNKGQDLTDRLGIPGCSISKFNLNQEFPKIMSTDNKQFNCDGIRKQVIQDFYDAFELLMEKSKNINNTQSI